jgi:elongation factor P
MTMTATPVSDPGAQRRELEYAYQDGDGLVLFDPTAEALVRVPRERAASSLHYLKEGDRVVVLFHLDEPLMVEPPTTVRLLVTDTDPPLAGTAAPKLALLETGLRIRVPAFIATGDWVIVDPHTRAYVGRADPVTSRAP